MYIVCNPLILNISRKSYHCLITQEYKYSVPNHIYVINYLLLFIIGDVT